MIEELEETVFPNESAHWIINKLNINADNISEIKEVIYYINSLTTLETFDIVSELTRQTN